MGRALRLLIIEDVEDHALLIVRELQKGGFDPAFERVETLQELEAALELRTWDAIISDFNLTGFDGIDVLRAVQKKGLDLPFLLVSGAIGEEKAAEVMRAGAHDYIRKGNYARLSATLERELLNTKVRHERRLSAEELTRHREHLEELVQVRTEELVRANEALQAEIDERKRAEEALLRAKEEWERTFNSVPDLIAILDDRYRIIRVNRAMAERLGRQPDDCLGLLCYQTIHGSEFAPESCPHPKTQSDAGEHHAVALESHLGGQFLITTTPLTQDGESKGTVYMARDLTERMRAQEEIARLNAKLAARVSELEERNLELEAFNRMVSHDLRQPLNSIGLACQTLELMCSNDLEEICKTTIQIAYKSTLRMNTMIETLLKFAGSAQAELQRESINLCDLASEIIAEARLAEPDRKVTFTCGAAPTANGDSSLLRTALENLIGNALKYTGKREEALIEFGATEIDGNQAYFIRDNGKGFDMVDADKLFIPFQRLPDTEEYKGFGIGLATVERIIRRHGGRIWAEGEPDKGATFYFTLDGTHSSSEE